MSTYYDPLKESLLLDGQSASAPAYNTLYDSNNHNPYGSMSRQSCNNNDNYSQNGNQQVNTYNSPTPLDQPQQTDDFNPYQDNQQQNNNKIISDEEEECAQPYVSLSAFDHRLSNGKNNNTQTTENNINNNNTNNPPSQPQDDLPNPLPPVKYINPGLPTATPPQSTTDEIFGVIQVVGLVFELVIAIARAFA